MKFCYICECAHGDGCCPARPSSVLGEVAVNLVAVAVLVIVWLVLR